LKRKEARLKQKQMAAEREAKIRQEQIELRRSKKLAKRGKLKLGPEDSYTYHERVVKGGKEKDVVRKLIIR
jgi:hypothetical protein